MVQPTQAAKPIKPTKPLVHYFGGKWALAQWIIGHMPDHQIYVEPFGGAASVLIQKEATKIEVYNDLDSNMVNLFRVLQDRVMFDELHHRLTYTLHSRQEYESSLERPQSTIDSAYKLIVRGWLGFGAKGIFERTSFRTNNKTKIDPAKVWKSFVDELPLLYERMRSVHIECRDFEQVIAGYDSPNTLFYVDPPYVLSSRSYEVYNHEMSNDDHVRLYQSLSHIQGMAIVSGYANDLYKKTFDNWHRVTTNFYANAGSNGNSKREEVIWMNEACRRGLNVPKQIQLL